MRRFLGGNLKFQKAGLLLRSFFTCAVVSAIVAPPTAQGQTSASGVPRVGVLTFAPLTKAAQEEFRRGFREEGYVEGKNIVLEWRSADGDPERANALAKELVALKVNVIIAEFTPAVRAAQLATSTIPIVMASAGDPVATGFVQTLARPGGNITGVTNLASELSAKRLQLLREMMPRLQRVGLLLNGSDPLDAAFITATEVAAKNAGIQVYVARVPRAEDLEPAVAFLTKERVDAAIVLANIPIASAQVARLLASHRLPSMSLLREFPAVGGLASYGPSVADIRRGVPSYVAKILKGAKPGDLPVEQPTKIELVINLKTAQTLGISFPSSIVERADSLIK